MFEGSRIMSKKTGKIILATALIGAAAAGTYYYLKKKKEAESFDFDYYFKDLSYYTGFPCAYNLEMKYFDNIFKKDLF
jgi:hypothetical protein